MSKRTAIITLIATVIPLVNFLFFIFLLLADQLAGGLWSRDAVRELGRTWIVFHLVTWPWGLALAIVYCVFLFRVPGTPYPRQALWSLGFFWAGGFAMPLFWYLHLRRFVTADLTERE